MGYGNPTGLSFMEQRIVAALLEAGETYPLHLVKQSKEPLNHRAVYTQLLRLEEKGLVSSRVVSDPTATKFPYRRRCYQVTEAGKRALQAWKAASEAWSSSA